jgi:hypothetical protein
VLVASRDPRFLRLARFLLGGRDLEVEELTTPERLPDAILEPSLELAVLDGGSAVAEALRTANAARARRPEVPVVIAADAGGKTPAGVRVFDRWNETEELLLDIGSSSRSASREQLPGTLTWAEGEVAFVREPAKMRR